LIFGMEDEVKRKKAMQIDNDVEEDPAWCLLTSTLFEYTKFINILNYELDLSVTL
jgi:hypothetical protein